MGLRQLRRSIKLRYYKALCMIFHPLYVGNKYKIIKRCLAFLSPGNASVAWLKVTGKVHHVGYRSWLIRTAKSNGIECFVLSDKKYVEALLVGSQSSVEQVARAAWKGPPKARVVRIIERWFNSFYADIEASKEKYLWSPKIAERLMENTGLLGSLLQKPNRFDVTENVSNAGELKRAALNHNLFVFRHKGINYLFSPHRQIGLHGSQTSRVSTTLRSITNNKELTKSILSGNGLPVPEGRVFTELAAAVEFFKQFKRPVVVKPLAGSFGTGVTIDVRTVDELKGAWEYAKKRHNQIIVEEMIEGIDVRVIIVGGVAKAALLRVPANVVGDGKSTIQQLIDKKNESRLLNPRLAKAPIITDFCVKSVLHKQGYTLKSVPAEGEIVFLNLKANIEAGGDSISITEKIHPDILKLAERAAACFDANDFWGVDLLLERLDLPPTQQRCAIIEMNSRANIYNIQFPLHGPPFDAAKALIEYLFPEKVSDADYPEKSIRLVPEGLLGPEFSDFACSVAQKYGLRVNVSRNDSVVISVAGKQHKLFFFLNALWEWMGERELVDGLKVTWTDDEITKNCIHNSDTQSPSTSAEQDVLRFDKIEIARYENLGYDDPDRAVFYQELQNRGYTGRHLYEEIFEAAKSGRKQIIGMHHSSIFCDKLCEQVSPMKKLLSFFGFPTPRGVRFTVNQRARALQYIQVLSGPCKATAFYPDFAVSELVDSVSQLDAFWDVALGKGAFHIMLEENVPGHMLCIAVVSGQAHAALAIEPVAIIGDGEKSVEELIAEKNRLRKINPWYGKRLIEYEDTLLCKLSIAREYVPKRGEKLLLESPGQLNLGGESINVTSFLHQDFMQAAVRAVQTIPGLEFAYVYLIVPWPTHQPSGQRWVISRIDTRPPVAMFHFPWKGKPVNLAKVIINNFLPN